MDESSDSPGAGNRTIRRQLQELALAIFQVAVDLESGAGDLREISESLSRAAGNLPDHDRRSLRVRVLNLDAHLGELLDALEGIRGPFRALVGVD
jgi:hypothetical protein